MALTARDAPGGGGEGPGPPRRSDAGLAARIWAVTAGLVGVAAVAVGAVLATGGPAPLVAAGVVGLAALAVLSYRSGGRFTAEAVGGRALSPSDPPAVRTALLDVCERAGRPYPRVLLADLNAPGAVAGYERGRPLLVVDPLLARVVGPEGLRAIFAHELGHLGRDVHTDAVRAYLPRVVGFGTFWVVFLAGRGPTVAGVGTAGYLLVATAEDRRLAAVRMAAGLGTETLALAASRYANRLEEYRADSYAAGLVGPDALVEALYRIAAVATGVDDEDVAGPVPWNADRSRAFATFATHPSVEDRAAALGVDLPAWVDPHRPHRRDR
ncbi:MAG: M48 family metallopeptidase [Halobacteriaceae archaeon]